MAYVTPIYDRTAQDLIEEYTKAYFNVADWVRIYDNALYTRNEIQAATGMIIQFDTLPTPTITTIPSVTTFNTLLANIERLRLASGVAGTTTVPANWQAGANVPSPSYVDVNLWERTIHQVHFVYNEHGSYAIRYARPGVSTTGSTKTWQHKWRP